MLHEKRCDVYRDMNAPAKPLLNSLELLTADEQSLMKELETETNPTVIEDLERMLGALLNED